jgi:hypothetical protein
VVSACFWRTFSSFIADILDSQGWHSTPRRQSGPDRQYFPIVSVIFNRKTDQNMAGLRQLLRLRRLPGVPHVTTICCKNGFDEQMLFCFELCLGLFGVASAPDRV